MGAGDCYTMHDSGLDQYGSCGSDEVRWGFEQNLKIEPIGFPDALYVECESRMTPRFLARGGRRKLSTPEKGTTAGRKDLFRM